MVNQHEAPMHTGVLNAQEEGGERKLEYVIQPELVQTASVYWKDRIMRLIHNNGSYAREDGADGNNVLTTARRQAKVYFLNPFRPLEHEIVRELPHETLQRMQLGYLIKGFADIAAGMVFQNTGKIQLFPGMESLQFASYDMGDHYVTHTDSGRDNGERQISVTVCVQSAVEGGELYFEGIGVPEEDKRMMNQRGAGVAFLSDTPHGVSPVLKGQRISITGWFKGVKDVKATR